MKKLLLIALFFSFFANATWADHKNKFIVHITDKRNSMVVMQAVDNLVQHYGDDAEIILVANGPAVELFQKKLGKPQLMENLQVLNVEVGVCAVAMQQFDIPEDHVFPGVEILKDTGIVRVMELQKKGYLYVKI